MALNQMLLFTAGIWP